MSREKSYLEKQVSRRPEKKKNPLNEGPSDSRMAKISFKNYLRQIEEDLLEEDDDLFEEEFYLPVSGAQIEDLYDKFLTQELLTKAKAKESPDDGAEFLMSELKQYFIDQGISETDADEWLDSDYGQKIFDMFWEGLV